MSYLDSFVLPVKRADLEAYFKTAAEMALLWRELGALSVTESVGDGLAYGKVTSFPRAVQAGEDEVVVLATITYRNKAHKEAVVAAAFADARMLALMENTPVDGTRMIWGGFDIIVNDPSPHV